MKNLQHPCLHIERVKKIRSEDQEKKIADEIKAKSEASKAELEKVKEDMKKQMMADMKEQTAKEMKIKQ